MMKLFVQIAEENFEIDLNEPIDLSIPLSPQGPKAWYVSAMKFSPVISTQFRGSVKLGGSVNFNDVSFNPHGHGTHTESVGHIVSESWSINKALKTFFFQAEVITIEPEVAKADKGWQKVGDRVITKEQLLSAIKNKSAKALIIRTLPNEIDKCTRDYSNSNFPYIDQEAMKHIAAIGIEHLLVDLPSVDRENDGGLLLGHRAFWRYPEDTRMNCTITEFVFVPNEVEDGTYLLNLQVASFENDAASSRPVLYRLKPPQRQ